ncbi:fatty acid desaturase family protein [Paraburkholderia acidiphila]|uniref:Fatty acid desaturase n=1 Tax=Paraburkholderia acidiphila TaxID=2571747 RepID=A0A7Z2G9R5_9BURK|nr:fatty acid desaturase family protein [Paraburkholderia acidiphila]QGZ57732.1 fatty acid desaturase [Paraburkholderia acidiphila]
MQITKLISREELSHLTRTSNLRATGLVLVNFALIAAGFALPIVWHTWEAWLGATVLLGARALGLGILVHDTAHGTLFSSRKINQWAGKWLFGGLPNVPFEAYRNGHLAHHRNAGTEADADLAFVDRYPASGASLARKFARDLSGLNGIKNLYFQIRTFRLKDQVPFIVSHALLLALLCVMHHAEVYLCWWLGQIFVFPIVMRLRVMGEHGGVPDHFDRDPRKNTGTTLAGPLARLLCAPNYVNYHVEHHFAAAVPSYRLRALHLLLKSKGCYEGWTCVQPSYFAVIKRCWSGHSTAGLPPDSKRVAKGALNNMQ